jgi:hypothetical protein
MSGDNDFNDLGWSVQKTSEKTGESRWMVWEHLRRGDYEAVKSGRRTIILPDTVRRHWATKPRATFAPPRQRSAATQTQT